MKTTKFFVFAGVFYLFFCLSAVVLRAETVNLIYINGIKNTNEQAKETANEIRSALEEEEEFKIGIQKKSFKIHTVWNPIGFYYERLELSPTSDVQELFLLKTAEEHYYQDFLDMSQSFDQQAAQRVRAYLEDMLPGDNYLESNLNPLPLTDAKMADTQTAVYRLSAQIINLQPVIVVAHSEGNLLANLAYAYLVSFYGDDVKKMVRIINVANTSAFSVDNLNFTHEGDAALFSDATNSLSQDVSLETLPSKMLWGRKTPLCDDESNGFCDFRIADPTFGEPDYDLAELDADHSMQGTYLSWFAHAPLLGDSVTFETPSFRQRFVDFVYAAANSFNSCGAYVAPGVWKEFDCYNLAAIGKTTNDDPFTPSWRLIGGYWQWGRKGPDPSDWYDTNTSNFAHGPIGPDPAYANSDVISEWDTYYDPWAPDGSWSDDSKTANDPCPAGYRVPTDSQWDGVIRNNTKSVVGTWSTNHDDHTNYSAAKFFGADLMLPVAGYRSSNNHYNYVGVLYFRGGLGYYWSSTEASYNTAWTMNYEGSFMGVSTERNRGCSVRCIAE